MHDRLRLDVAVSNGDEIFSWHGGKQFSSAGIDDVVKSGPISSGSFVGFLRNIFLARGVEVRYQGVERGASGERFVFSYNVPLAASNYQVQNRQTAFTVPFHGSFSAGESTFQLESLSVLVDSLPEAAEICAASIEITYQMVNISGKASLIPKLFELRLDDPWHVDSTSRSQYTECREFRGESKIHFDFDDAQQPQSTSVSHDEWLPPKIGMHIKMLSAIDDQTTFTGDPVEGVLLSPIRLKHSKVVIPKGATLQGVVSKLEFHYEPFKYHLVSIRFDRLTFGPNSFLLEAVPQRSPNEAPRTISNYGLRLPSEIPPDLQRGSFLWQGSHFHTDQHFSGYWETTAHSGKRQTPEQFSAAKP